MKNVKRFSSLFLAWILALSLAVPAFAAVDDTGFFDKEGLEVTYSSYDRAEISEWLENAAH